MVVDGEGCESISQLTGKITGNLHLFREEILRNRVTSGQLAILLLR